MKKNKILIFGCGAVGSSIAFLLTLIHLKNRKIKNENENKNYDSINEIYLAGEFNSEKKFLEDNYIEYRMYEYDKTFKINIKKFDFEKNFFIPDLIISTFKIGGIFIFNNFLKKFDKFLTTNKFILYDNENKNIKKISINVLFLQNGTGWEKYIEKNFDNFNINILRGLIFYNVTKNGNAITQTSKGEIILQNSSVLKKIFKRNFKNFFNKYFDKKNNIIKVKFEKNIDRLIISKLVINSTNGIFTYLGITFYDALKNIEVAKLLKDSFLFLILILKVNKIKFKRTKTLDPLEIIEFIKYFYVKKNLKIFFKFFIKYYLKKFKISYLKGKNKFNFKEIIYENFLESIPKGFNSLYQTIYDNKKTEIYDLNNKIKSEFNNKLNYELNNEFNFIIDFFIEKAYNINNNCRLNNEKIKSFNLRFLYFIKEEINKLFEDKKYNYNLSFEEKLKILKSFLYK